MQNTEIQDYAYLKDALKLEELYINLESASFDCNNQIEKLGNGLKDSQLTELKKFGIFGYDVLDKNWDSDKGIRADTFLDTDCLRDFSAGKTSELTDISGLENISDTTKSAIQYMYLNDNNLTDNGGLSVLAKFTGLQYLTVTDNSNLTNLNGLENLNLINFYAQNCNLLSIEGLKGNNSLKILSIKNNPNLTSLAGIEYNDNCTNLTEIRASYCKISDISALEGSNVQYLSLSSQRENALKNVNTLQNCMQIRYLYLAGNTAIYESDIVLIKNIILACETNYSLDKKYSLVFLEQAKCDLSNYNLTSEQFSLLTNNESILELNLTGNDSLTNEDIEKVLSTCTKVQKLIIDNINLTTINFVKNMPNLWYLDIRGCSNLNDLNVLEELAKEKKLAIGELYIDNDNIQLKNIQTALNSIYSRYSYGGRNGIKLGTVSLVKQLEECTELTSIATYGGGNATNVDLDFTKLTKLTNVNVCSVKWNMKFPVSLENYKSDGGTGVHDFSLCENLSTIDWVFGAPTNEELESIFSTIINNKNTNLQIKFTWVNFNDTSLNLKNLKKSNVQGINISGSATNDLRLQEITTTVDIPSLQTITISGYTVLDTIDFNALTNLNTISISNSNINSLDGIRQVSTLKEVNINNSSIGNLGDLTILANIENLNLSSNNIADISSVSVLSNLKTLNLSNNNISNLTPLNNLTNLQNLNLSNNAIENYYFSFNNIDVLKNLNKNKLTQLNISGNNFSDTSELKKLKWNSYTE